VTIRTWGVFAVAWIGVAYLCACASQPVNEARHLPFNTPTSWTLYQGTDTNNPVFPGTLSTTWTFKTGGRINGGLAVVGDTIFVDSFSKKLFALNVETGRLRWKASLPNIVMSTPIVADGLVIVGTGTNAVLPSTPQSQEPIWGRPKGDEVVAFDERTGRTVWRFHTIGEDMPTPALVGHTLVFGNGDRHAYGIDVKTGKRIWSIPIPGITTMSGTSRQGTTAFITVSGATAPQYAHPSHLLAVDARSGRTLWMAPYGNSDSSAAMASGIIATEGSIDTPYGAAHFVGSAGENDVEAYSVANGKLLWRWVGRPGFYTNFESNERAIASMISDGILYQPVPTTDEVIAFHLKDGRIRWRFRTAGPVKMSPVLTNNGILIFGDTEGILYAVNARTGLLNNLAITKQPFSVSPPIIVGKTLFIAHNDDVEALPLENLVIP